MAHPLIEGTAIRKAYGLQTVLQDVSFLIDERQKIALIGRNGAGKSTLLNILTATEETDEGTVRIYPTTRVGVVKQHEILPNYETSMQFLQKKSSKADWEVSKQAAAFGLTQQHLDVAPSTLSGGYQMRVKLVAMLLQDPNLLILDEPVNYLDLQTLLLLEQFLQSYKGAYIIAAHDRTFLEHTCDQTYEIERGALTTYNGSVSEYFTYKEEQIAFRAKTNKRLRKEIAHNQTFVDRFRYKANLASRAQNKLKHIERLRRQLTHIDGALSTVNMHIPSPQLSTGPALRVDELSIGYGNAMVADGICFELQRGEKIVIAGENGNGKTTLLKTLAGELDPLQGEIKWWHRTTIGYYDQKTEATLMPGESVLQYLTRMAPSHASGESLLMMAGTFLFKDDDLEKSVNVLSGGERARLCLAGILLHEYNTLLLDEPTNHLDVETTEALAIALKQYSGTVIVISHARNFVDTLVDRVYEIRHGKLRQYMGSYEDYVQDLVCDARAFLTGDQPESESSSTDRARVYTQIKEIQRRQERLMKRIDELEAEKSEILAYFFDNPTDYSPHRSQRLTVIHQELEDHEAEWLRAQEEIDVLRKES